MMQLQGWGMIQGDGWIEEGAPLRCGTRRTGDGKAKGHKTIMAPYPFTACDAAVDLRGADT